MLHRGLGGADAGEAFKHLGGAGLWHHHHAIGIADDDVARGDMDAAEHHRAADGAGAVQGGGVWRDAAGEEGQAGGDDAGAVAFDADGSPLSDELALRTLQMGGRVLVVEADRVPDGLPMVAILRY